MTDADPQSATLRPRLEALLRNYGVRGISIATLRADGRITTLAVGDADASHAMEPST